MLRAWVPGCGTGEEAYTLAIALCEMLDSTPPPRGHNIRIFASDVDASAIECARRGEFSSGVADHVAATRLDRFFTESQGTYRVRSTIRDMIVFAEHDLAADPPFIRLDILSCRDVLQDLSPESRARLLPLFGFCLRPGGTLLLGRTESIEPFSMLFSPVDGHEGVYRRR